MQENLIRIEPLRRPQRQACGCCYELRPAMAKPAAHRPDPARGKDDKAGSGGGKPKARDTPRWGGWHTAAGFGAALVVRLALMAYGVWQDNNFAVKYTDVDYVVFTDAAAAVQRGGSPYDRGTYRYTPLLAWMLLPNLTLHPAFGKLLFIAADMGVGWLLYALLRMRGVAKSSSFGYMCVFMFHPLSINVSTRGNADTLVSLLVLATMYLAFQQRWKICAVMFGLAVHLKIYPIIYVVPLVLLITSQRNRGAQFASWPWWRRTLAVVNCGTIQFGVISGGVFLGLIALFYRMYGYEFLYETYLYHFVRADNRHNFSVYFYDLYLRYNQPSRLGVAVVAFLPQVATFVVLGVAFHKDLPLAMFAQTLAFVAFNKVCTAQYFLWYICLLPVIIPQSRLPFRSGWLPIIVFWFGAEFFWLGWAYQLEMLGKNTFLQVWLASIVFFAANIFALVQVIRAHTLVPVFSPSGGLQKLKLR